MVNTRLEYEEGRRDPGSQWLSVLLSGRYIGRLSLGEAQLSSAAHLTHVCSHIGGNDTLCLHYVSTFASVY